mgnify:CR=1 FL=1
MSVSDEVFKPSIVLVSVSDLEGEVKKLADELKALKEEGRVREETIIKRVETLERSLSWLNVIRAQAVWKSRSCRHSVNGVCEAWHVADPEKIGIPVDAVVVTEGPYKKISLTKFPELCATCPLYEARK